MPDNILYIGHSLVGPVMPTMMNGFLTGSGSSVRVDHQVINGAPIWYNWENGATAEGVDARAVIPSGDYAAVIVTEAIPLDSHLMWSGTFEAAQRYADLAHAANPQTQFYIYETWHSLGTDPALWRAQLDTDLAKWEGIADHIDANAAPGTLPTLLVPAGQAMARLYDAIEAGQVPGLTSIADIFSDDIHLNDLGNWFLSAVQAATVAGLNPHDLPLQTFDIWGGAFDAPGPDLASALTGVVAQTLNAYDRDGRDAVPLEGETDPGDPGGDGGGDPGDDPGGDDPVLELPAGIGFGLSGVADWTPNMPFLDIFKTSRPFIGHEPGSYGGASHADLEEAGVFDQNGWPRFIPEGLESIGTLILTELPAEMTQAAGTYHVRWEGAGEVRLGYSASNVTYGTNEAWFDYVPDGSGLVSVEIRSTDPDDTGDHIRNLSVIKQEHVALHDSGAIFNPAWLDIIDDGSVLRFMDWMETNGSTQASVGDMPQTADASWAHDGVPLEVMLALANQTGIDPWFNIPHLADAAYIEAFVTQVRDGLDPGLKAYFEFSNEVWNFQFAQSHHALAVGAERFDGAGDAWVQNYAADAVAMARIIDQVYGEGSDAVVKVLATHTGWQGLESSILLAPDWVAEDPANNADPYTYFDAYAITGYFDGGLGRGYKAQEVLDWIAQSAAAATAEASDLGLEGAAAQAYVEAHRYDAATQLALQELRDGSVTGDPDGSLAALQGLFAYHAGVAAQYGLELVAYEGGTHVVGVGQWQGDAALTDFFTHLNYSAEMGTLYTEMFGLWEAEGGSLFTAFTAVDRPSQYGSWGHLRHLDDSNPRMDALRAYWDLGAGGGPASGTPAILGEAEEGQTLFADISDIQDPEGIDGATLAYQWLRDGTPITGAESETFVLQEEDVGTRLSVTVSYRTTDGTARSATSLPIAPVEGLNDPAQGAPSIIGTPLEGEVLSVDTSAVGDPDGMTNATLSFQWLRDEAEIGQATDATYLLAEADIGAVISLRLRFTDDRGGAEELSSVGTTPVALANRPASGPVTVSGELLEGTLLQSDISLLSDPDGLNTGVPLYQWLRDGTAITGATGPQLLLTADEIGTQISLRIRLIDDRGTPEELFSTPGAPVQNRNDAPEGRLDIIGTPTQGALLLADLVAFSDADGMGEQPGTYTWLRDGEVVASGPQLTYRLTQQDVGTSLAVRYDYVDFHGTPEQLISEATLPVFNVNDRATATLSIIGDALEGEVLGVSLSDLSDLDGISQVQPIYQWQRDGVEIVGATGTTYLLDQDEVGSAISVVLRFTDDLGGAERLQSAATAPVINRNDLPTGQIIISGEPEQGAVLEARLLNLADPDGLGDVPGTFQWLRDGIDIAGSTGSTLQLTQADVGASLTAQYRFADAFGTEETLLSIPTAAIANRDDPVAGTLTINGLAQEDSLLTATLVGWMDADGLEEAEPVFQWSRDGVEIAGATFATYLTGQEDVGSALSVTMHYTDDLGGTGQLVAVQTGPVANLNDLPTGRLVVSGSFAQGSSLTARWDNVADEDGILPETITFQWLVDGDPIAGATGTTFVPGQAEVGSTVGLQFDYLDGQGTAESVLFQANVPVDNINDDPMGNLLLTGAAEEGAQLTVDARGLTDLDGIDRASAAITWLRDGAVIANATDTTYELGQADVGHQIGVRYSFQDLFGASEIVEVSFASQVLNVNDAPVGRPTISGLAEQGEVLTASLAALQDEDGLGSGNYQWLRDGAEISGAEGSQYQLTQSDVGAQISLRYSYVDGQDTAETVTSDPSGTVANRDDAPTGEIAVSGTARAGQRIEATLGTLADADGIDVTELSWSWHRVEGADINPVAGDPVLQIDAALSGASLVARLTYRDLFGTEATVESAPIIVNSPSQGAPELVGLTKVGALLRVDRGTLEDRDGIPLEGFTYQWLRDGVRIDGADQVDYRLTEADSEARIAAEVSFVDGNGFAEEAASVSHFVIADDRLITGSPAADTLTGASGNDTILGGAGNDLLRPGAGADLLVGGTGADEVTVTGVSGNYTLTLSGAGLRLTDRREVTDGVSVEKYLEDIEFLSFDASLAPLGLERLPLDLFTGAAALDPAGFAEITELYIAYFNRAPDALGLYYWASEYANGVSLDAIARSFFDQPETRETYQNALSPDGSELVDIAAFVTTVYENVLGRSPDLPGFAYWSGQLENNAGVVPATFILSILNGAKYPGDPNAQTAADQAYLLQKADLGAWFAAVQGFTDVELGQEVMAHFDGTDAGLIAARTHAEDALQRIVNGDVEAFLMPLVGVMETSVDLF